MKLCDVYAALDKYAPFELSKRYCEEENGYDNSGVIINTDDEITGIVFSLDFSYLAVNKAIELGYNLIITHHPAIYHPIKCVDGAIQLAANHKIGVISCHINLDMAKEGIDYYFAKGLGAKNQEILTKYSDFEGYGRRFFLGKPLKDIVRHAEEEFNTTVLYYGADDKLINYAASFCGAGLFGDHAEAEADLLCSADVPHHVILGAVEEGKAVIVFTHYSCEKYGFMKLYEAFSTFEGFENTKKYFLDDNRLF